MAMFHQRPCPLLQHINRNPNVLDANDYRSTHVLVFHDRRIMGLSLLAWAYYTIPKFYKNGNSSRQDPGPPQGVEEAVCGIKV